MVMNITNTAEEFKESLQEILRKGECEVIFRKNDGSEREMVCTLKQEYLPLPDESKKTKVKKADNPGVITVWEVDIGEWRSFRVDSILSGPTLIG